jgi:lysophospholipid acyltransferase (LPLAT)-like uncharacterized protein
LIGSETRPAKFVAKPDIEGERRHARLRPGLEVKRNAEQAFQRPIIWLEANLAILPDGPRVAVDSAGGGVSDNAVEERPGFSFLGRCFGH